MLTVAAFYKFIRLKDLPTLREALIEVCTDHGVKGTILLAEEGINGTIAGTEPGVAAVLGRVRAVTACGDLDWKRSWAETMPFGRLRVRLKREIVTMGKPGVDPAATVGTYVEAADWNALITAPDVVVIDTRNDFEVEIGSFANALDPKTSAFGDFPAWWDANKAALSGKKLALFCTGGIRCEKATSWLLDQGETDVHLLKGGILKYLETIPKEASLWRGACFVFDQRVSLTHRLERGSFDLCHACRRPLSAEDQAKPEYESGVSCHRCLDEYSDSDRDRFRERERQIRLAQERDSG